MILNENDSRAINSLVINHDKLKKKTDIKESHLYFLCFKIPAYEILPLIFMGVEIIAFENSILKIYKKSNSDLTTYIIIIPFQWVGIQAMSVVMCSDKRKVIKRIICLLIPTEFVQMLRSWCNSVKLSTPFSLDIISESSEGWNRQI